MTRTHAAYQLLRHGPLDSAQFKEITGWKTDACEDALRRLRRQGRIRLIARGGGPKRSVYEVVQ